MKNHFHTCIIKSVRKIINNKFDCELKEIMRYFYAFDYLIKMISEVKEEECCNKSGNENEKQSGRHIHCCSEPD